MKNLFLYILILAAFSSCEDKPKDVKPIVLGDTSNIVTETNPTYLENHTEDISPTNKKSDEGEIRSMMMQVDSAKSVQKLEEEPVNQAPLSGFSIHFTECDVVFDGLSAHAIQNTQNERTSNSVSYVKDGGNMNEMPLQINGLEEIKVEQRIFTRLQVDNGTEQYMLNDLSKFISPWSTLAGKDKKFISLSQNSLQFFPTDNAKLRNALDRELRKKKKSRLEIEAWMKTIQKTNSYTEPPCKIVIASCQWRIIGKKDGKRVQKLIQFDIP